jgi:hypothetical protein
MRELFRSLKNSLKNWPQALGIYFSGRQKVPFVKLPSADFGYFLGPDLACKMRARVRLGLYTLGSGFLQAWVLICKIGLGLLLNKPKIQAHGLCPKPKPIIARARAFDLFSKSPSLLRPYNFFAVFSLSAQWIIEKSMDTEPRKDVFMLLRSRVTR